MPNAGMSLDHEYPEITQQELLSSWQAYMQHPDASVQPTVGVLGALAMTENMPHTYLSVDVCEVLRGTHECLRTIEEAAGTPIDEMHEYGNGLKSLSSYADIQSVAQVMMNAKLVKPAENIHLISSIMQQLRRSGAYIFANTSTLPGCEQATVDFFADFLPGCFDGIVFPRNFSGQEDGMNKGKAAATVMRQCLESAVTEQDIEAAEYKITAVHIDDRTPHHETFLKEVGTVADAVMLLQPEYPSQYATHEAAIGCDTPLDSFLMARYALRSRLGIDA